MTSPTYRETSQAEPAKELVQKRALVAEAEPCAVTLSEKVFSNNGNCGKCAWQMQ
jgi:hypothetical protein